MGMWKKDAAVAVSGGSDHRQKDQKRCLDAHWLPTGQHEHFHKGQLLYALTQPQCRGTKNEGLLQDHLCPLQMSPQHPHESRTGPDGKAAKVSRWSRGAFIQDLKAHRGCPWVQVTLWICSTDWPLGWMGASKQWTLLAPLRPPHPTTSPLNVTAGFR